MFREICEIKDERDENQKRIDELYGELFDCRIGSPRAEEIRKMIEALKNN